REVVADGEVGDGPARRAALAPALLEREDVALVDAVVHPALLADPIHHLLAACDREDTAWGRVVAHEKIAGADVLHRLRRAVEHQHAGALAEAFAHGGPGGDDDEVGLLPAAGHVVERVEAARHAGDAAVAVAQRLELLERLHHDLAHRA